MYASIGHLWLSVLSWQISETLWVGLGRRRILEQFNDEEEHHPVAEPLSHELLINQKHTGLLITDVPIRAATHAQNNSIHHISESCNKQTLSFQLFNSSGIPREFLTGNRSSSHEFSRFMKPLGIPQASLQNHLVNPLKPATCKPFQFSCSIPQESLGNSLQATGHHLMNSSRFRKP